MSRTLLLQLARLGDLIQSLPAITSLHTQFPEQHLDLLCASPLASLGRLFIGIQQVYPWDGEQWHTFALMLNQDREPQMEAVRRYWANLALPDYALAYNLNNHPRSILASHLLGAQVVGAGDRGPLNPSRPAWVEYLQQVARVRGSNRIHLADAFCGLCGVRPPRVLPTIQASDVELPSDFAQMMNDSSLMKIGIVLGAGDVDRRVPITTWCHFIESCAEHLPNCLCVIIGGAGEREAALALEDQLPPHYLARILNCVGRTTLPQLAHLFNRCQWVVGSDTGPLHLAVACGARAIGWYFSRARVHETGPYGVGHYVWQYRRTVASDKERAYRLNDRPELPCSWPVMETIHLLRHEQVDTYPKEWELWTSHRDHLGAFFSEMGHPTIPPVEREQVWQRLTSPDRIDGNSIMDVLEVPDYPLRAPRLQQVGL